MSTIKLGSKSYPYLAVAKHYNVPYREVLAFLDKGIKYCQAPWQIAVVKAEAEEMERRRRVRRKIS